MQIGSGMAPLAVDQDQRIVGRNPPQASGQGKRPGIAAARFGREGGDQLRQRLNQVRLTDTAECVGTDNGDGGRTVGRRQAGDARAGDNDGFRIGQRQLLRLGDTSTGQHARSGKQGDAQFRYRFKLEQGNPR